MAGGERAVVRTLVAAILALLAGALAVRGIPSRVPPAPEDRPEVDLPIRQPMQFLGPGARLRIQELTPLIGEARATDWKKAHRLPFEVRDCPKLLEWIAGPDGQRLEALAGDLRRGTRDEALAGLTLVFQVARATRWDPGFLGHGEHAERLGGLLQEWLRAWGERSASDPLLHEPAQAALLLYGRAMRAAYKAPLLRRAPAPYERARGFLDRLLGGRGGPATAFGESFAARRPRAWTTFLERDDFLLGFEEEARLAMPDLDGECDG